MNTIRNFVVFQAKEHIFGTNSKLICRFFMKNFSLIRKLNILSSSIGFPNVIFLSISCIYTNNAPKDVSFNSQNLIYEFLVHLLSCNDFFAFWTQNFPLGLLSLTYFYPSNYWMRIFIYQAFQNFKIFRMFNFKRNIYIVSKIYIILFRS